MERRILTSLLLFAITVFLPLSSLAETPVAFKTIKLKNNCGFTIWPAVADSFAASFNATKKTPTVLASGKIYRMHVDPFWSGSIWGRVGCAGKKPCDDMYATKATFEFLGGIAKPDTYTVTLENGYNLPIAVVPHTSKNELERWKSCGSMACRVDAENVCPKYLQVRRKGKGRGGVVTACKGRCDGYLCSPPQFRVAFRKACPRAFPFSGSASLCPPSTVSYTLTFCPDYHG